MLTSAQVTGTRSTLSGCALYPCSMYYFSDIHTIMQLGACLGTVTAVVSDSFLQLAVQHQIFDVSGDSPQLA